MNVTQKLIKAHVVTGTMIPGDEIALKVDQTLCQDATGTLVMLELEAMELKRTKADVSVQYVDHNLLQEDNKNADDHLFLESAAKRFGFYYSGPGNGISHVVHMQHFGKPGQVLVGSDSHTCAGGALAMLAIGAGGLEVAMAVAGHPLYLKMPRVWGIELTGEMPPWVSAKDIVLHLLQKYGVKGGVGFIFEYFGEGLHQLSAMDRHVIANMGAELGATTSVFPSDQVTKAFLEREGRGQDWVGFSADDGALFDQRDVIDLSALEPLIAKPSSPGDVVPVADLAGEPIYQAYIGSSANPGYRDYAIAAAIVEGKTIKSPLSFDINPSSRSILEELIRDGYLGKLIRAGARLHQAGCNGCIGMGQAPATNKNSLRTVPRNFPGRSGTLDDRVFLCSPETAAASALTGVITDPRTLKQDYPDIATPKSRVINSHCIDAPIPYEKAKRVVLIKGPNIVSLPQLTPLPEAFNLPVLLKVGHHISTDEISPAGAKVLPYRSNIPKISQFTFSVFDPEYVGRASMHPEGHAIIAGENYGQGSSREHAALAPRYLGLRLVIAISFARIHWQNLINFGILPLVFKNPKDYAAIGFLDVIKITELPTVLEKNEFTVKVQDQSIQVCHALSARQKEVLYSGGLINWLKNKAS